MKNIQQGSKTNSNILGRKSKCFEKMERINIVLFKVM